MTDLCLFVCLSSNHSGCYINNTVEEDKSWKELDQKRDSFMFRGVMMVAWFTLDMEYMREVDKLKVFFG